MIDGRIRFRHIRRFVEVAGRNAVSHSASRMNLAQPAVSRAIAGPEGIYGARPLDRSPGDRFLTADGSRIFHHPVAPCMAQNFGAFSLADPRVHAAEDLAAATPPTVPLLMLPDVLKRTQRLRPETTNRAMNGGIFDLPERLRRGDRYCRILSWCRCGSPPRLGSSQ